MPPPTIGGRGIVFWSSTRPSVCPSTLISQDAISDISLLSGEISVKLATNTYHRLTD